MPVTSPGGGQQRFAPLTTVEQIPLRQNIAYWQPITPALAVRRGCRRSGLAQKCCLRLAFAFDSDMESGNGRVPAPWCRVTDQMSQAAARSHRSAAQGAANQYKYRAYWPAMQRRAALRWPAQTDRWPVTRQLEPIPPLRLDLGRRLHDDGQRHLRCGAKGGDVAIGQPVGVVLAAVLNLKVQPRAPAFGAHFAAVGFAGQVHPGAGAVLDPVAVDAERRV